MLARCGGSGQPAELVRTYHTIEGDPIIEGTTCVGPRRIELFIDSTRDSFGTQRWTHWVCERERAPSGRGPLGGCRGLSRVSRRGARPVGTVAER